MRLHLVARAKISGVSFSARTRPDLCQTWQILPPRSFEVVPPTTSVCKRETSSDFPYAILELFLCQLAVVFRIGLTRQASGFALGILVRSGAYGI